MADYTTIRNNIFNLYYENRYLPVSMGGSSNTAFFNFLLALHVMVDLDLEETLQSKNWAGKEVTYYTKELPKLFGVPRFVGESEQDFLDRLLILDNISQNDDTMINATYSVVRDAVSSISDITIIDKLSGVSSVWGDEIGSTFNSWNDGSLWSDETTVQRAQFAIRIVFPYRGSDNDITTYDYWFQSKNYTKVEDVVKLYKPPGTTFELVLENVKVSNSSTVTSNTLIN
jgi:hypothetical protein